MSLPDIELLTRLRDLLVQAFRQDELHTLCWELLGDPEVVPGQDADKNTQAREIVDYFSKRQDLARLIIAARAKRPNHSWPSIDGVPTLTTPSTLLTPSNLPNLKNLPNPFHTRGRINDPTQFFGRERLVREVREALRKRSSLALLGERQIGKSSLLYFLWATRAEWLPGADLHYIDLQSVLDTEDFCETILKRLNASGNTPRDLKRVIEARIAAQQDVILMLDEVERLRGGDIDARIPNLFRALAQEQHFALCVAGNHALELIFPPSSEISMSELSNIFGIKWMQGFDEAEARAFLQTRLAGTGVQFATDEIARLWRESAGHPAKLQTLAHEAFARYVA